MFTYMGMKPAVLVCSEFNQDQEILEIIDEFEKLQVLKESDEKKKKAQLMQDLGLNTPNQESDEEASPPIEPSITNDLPYTPEKRKMQSSLDSPITPKETLH